MTTATLRRTLGFRRISAVYVLATLVVVYALWVPSTFLSVVTLKSVLVEQSVTAIIAIALVLPLAAGGFDLSVGYVSGMAAVVVAWAMVNGGQGPLISVLAALGAGAVVGAVNGALVTLVNIDSFIATLGTSSILGGLITYISNGQQILGLTDGFKRLGTGSVAGIGMPVVYLLVIAVAAWYVLEWTPLGRWIHATGGNAEGARLAGVPTRRVVAGTLVASALVASVAGVVVTARIGVGSPDVGPAYLLPAFAAAFLGSTQIHPGRFNVWGTVLAVYVLAVGVKGLELGGAPYWIPQLFNGAALLLAVGLARAGRITLPRRSQRPRRAAAPAVDEAAGAR